MSQLLDVLSEYARYHRDPRTLASHVLGVPMIMLGTATLLSRPGLPATLRLLSPALILATLAGVYYLRIDRRLGLLMGLLLAAMLTLGHWLAGQSTLAWLSISLLLVLAGWSLQLWGHYYEGRKPAFMDDLAQLLIGPLFVTVEVGFRLGLGVSLHQAIEHRAGRARRRPSPGPSASSAPRARDAQAVGRQAAPIRPPHSVSR